MDTTSTGRQAAVAAQRAAVFTPYSRARFAQLLAEPQRVVLVCHANPDGDAVGSMVGLALALRAVGHQVLPLSPNGIPRPLAWLGAEAGVQIYDELPGLFARPLAEATLLICLDFNTLSRADRRLAPALEQMECPRIMIDHHVDPADEFDLYFSYPLASSTAEVVYELLMGFGGEALITPPVASALYTGIMTDTGSFSYACHSCRPYAIAGQLLELGADIEAIRSRVYGSYTEQRMRLWGYALHQQMQLLADGRGAIISLSTTALDHFAYQPGDLEGLVNQPLSIAGVQVSVLLTARAEGMVRVSLRSRPGVEIHRLAQQHFNGGGHPQASGGTLQMSLGQAQRRAQAALLEYFRKQPSTPTER